MLVCFICSLASTVAAAAIYHSIDSHSSQHIKTCNNDTTIRKLQQITHLKSSQHKPLLNNHNASLKLINDSNHHQLHQQSNLIKKVSDFQTLNNQCIAIKYTKIRSEHETDNTTQINKIRMLSPYRILQNVYYKEIKDNQVIFDKKTTTFQQNDICTVDVEYSDNIIAENIHIEKCGMLSFNTTTTNISINDVDENINNHSTETTVLSLSDKSESISIKMRSTLNKNAKEFVPETAAFIEEEPQCIIPFIENEINYKWCQEPLYLSEALLLNHRRGIMWISGDITERYIRNEYIQECFDNDPKDLFYYLSKTFIMNAIDLLYELFTNKKGKENVLFKIELHNKYGEDLYVLGIENDRKTSKAEKWKMVDFMTRKQILNEYGKLPRGSREYNVLNEYRNFNKKDIGNISMINWAKLPIISSQKKQQKKQKACDKYDYIEFYKYIMNAINNIDDKYRLQPIIWINNKRNILYRVQMLLPVKLRYDNWIGITFNCDEENKLLIPSEICIDCKDIRHKLALFEPFRSKEQYKWLKNNIADLKVYDNRFSNKMTEVNAQNNEENELIKILIQENECLTQQLYEKDKLIEKKNKLIEELLREKLNT